MLFSPNDIRARFRQQPFGGVVIVTTTGQTYEVPHPDLVWVGENFLMVGPPSKSDPTIPTGQLTRIALAHVVELRDLNVVPPVGTNGST